jgi:glycosyltransferase involved in cell wall biosynthesis
VSIAQCNEEPGETSNSSRAKISAKGRVTAAAGISRPRLKLSILMCAFNEQQRIVQAIHEVLTTSYPCEIELIVIDDGSTDATAALVDKVDDPRLIWYRHPENKGKGAALRTAVALASGTHVLPFDADLEYLPDDIPRLIEPIIKRHYDVIYGTRLFGFNTVYQSYRYALGNRVMTRLANILFDASLSDLHTCLKLVPLSVFRELPLRETGFGLDTELTAALLRLGIRPFEVPVSYYSRTHAQGKKINWRDALRCVGILLRMRLTSKKRLAPIPGADEGGATTLVMRGGGAAGRTGAPEPIRDARLAVTGVALLGAGRRSSEEANATAAG